MRNWRFICHRVTWNYWKGLRRTSSEDTNESEGSVDSEEGFASAIAGIFDGLDGDDALLSEYPEVKFFEDDSHIMVIVR